MTLQTRPQAFERRRAAALAMAQADGPAREEARAQFRAASGEMSSIRVQAAMLVQDVTSAPNLDAQHLDGLRDGGSNRPGNGVALCRHHRAARTAIRADRRHYADDLFEWTRLDEYHAAVRSKSQYRRGGA